MASQENMNSPEFIKLLKNKDNYAVTTVVRSYTEHLYKAALGMGFVETQAEELVQRVWSTFFDAIVNFEGRSQVRTFLFGILYNKASELRRENTRHASNDTIDETMENKFELDGHWQSPPIDPERFLISAQVMDLINKCLDKLPLAQRMAFSLKEIDDQDSPEICKILDVTITNLGVLMFRARNSLRECIESKS